MAETKIYSPQEVVAQIATLVKERLQKFEGQVQELKSRELKLSKSELCPLCGGPDVNGHCNCLKKNAVQGYAGDPMHGSSPGQMGGGGAMSPMSMAEMGDAHHNRVDAKLRAKRVGNTERVEAVGEGIDRRTRVDNYGAQHGTGANKAPKYNMHKAVNGEGDGGMTGQTGLAQSEMAKHQMPSSSAAALAPKPAAPATSVATANKEMGGFKSLASKPHMPAAGGPSLVHGAGRKPISSMGRGSASAAGMIPHAKAEMSTKYSDRVGIKTDGTKGRASGMRTDDPQDAHVPQGQVGHWNDRKDTHVPKVKKSELAPNPKAVVDEDEAGTKEPKAGKEIDAEGSGGDIKKGKKLSKAMEEAYSPSPALKAKMAAKKSTPGKAPEGKGVGGKQPVGQGGGDAKKSAAPAKKAAPAKSDKPAPKKSAEPAAKTTPAAPAQKPAAAPVQAAPKPNALRAAGQAETQRMKTPPPIPADARKPAPAAAPAQKPAAAAPAQAAAQGPAHPAVAQSLANVAAARPGAPVDVDVSSFNAPHPANAPKTFYDRLRAGAQPARPAPHIGGTLGQRIAGTPAAAPRTGLDPISNMRAAGRSAGPAAGSQGATDAAAAQQLQADKKAGGVGFLNALKAKFRRGPAPDTVDLAPQRSQQGLKTSQRFHGAMPLQRNEKPMRKGALALSEMGDCAMCKKPLGKCLCKGMSMNHNRTMLAVKPTRSKKSR